MSLRMPEIASIRVTAASAASSSSAASPDLELETRLDDGTVWKVRRSLKDVSEFAIKLERQVCDPKAFPIFPPVPTNSLASPLSSLKRLGSSLVVFVMISFFASFVQIQFMSENSHDVLASAVLGAGGALVAYGVSFLTASSVSLSSNGVDYLKKVNSFLHSITQSYSQSHKLVFLALAQPPLKRDWPSRFGEIDLELHDLPHDSSATEWWYYHAHLEGVDRRGKVRDFAVFYSVFRVATSNDASSHGHAITYAIVDLDNERYHSQVFLEKSAPKTLFEEFSKNSKVGPQDPFVRRALMEVLQKGNLPLPDRLLSADPKCEKDRLHITFGTSLLEKTANGNYKLFSEDEDLIVDLTFEPVKKPVRHGDDGIVAGHALDEMFYYFVPRCDVTGTIEYARDVVLRKTGKCETEKGSVFVVTGDGWYDHEFGGSLHKSEDSDPADYAWEWVAIQLDNGSEVTAATLFEASSGRLMEGRCVFNSIDSERRQFDEDSFSLTPVKNSNWTSVKTFKSYPTEFRLTIPSLSVDVSVKARFGDQEFRTLIARPAFWEGRCDVSGSHTGRAFVERNGFGVVDDIGHFFKAVGKTVRQSVMDMYPLKPTHEQVIELIATNETKHYADGVDGEVLGQTLMAPVRLIADRGGKSWRSYAALACIDVVGGDSREFVQWIAMPEFLHVGSLIVDDIQDKSETRRGGECAHLKYGEPLAINAGTAAYFQTEALLDAPGLSAEELNQCYKLYFAALRGGHAGQALDIYGNDYLMDRVVESGDSTLLETRIVAIHRLKTAVPAGTLAKMGATVGKGTKIQIESVGRYFESVGLAFQIMDDVLNLRGLYSNSSDKLKQGTALKTLGEDIMEGKITMPIAKYMSLQPSKAKRLEMWKLVESKPQSQKIVNDCIAELESVGAIDACVSQADDIVTKAWEELDDVVVDSYAKMMLRSFGWFVCERAH